MTTYHVPDDEAAPVPGRHTGPLATDADQQPDTLPHKRQRPILFPQLPPLQFDDHAVYLSPEEEDDALYPAMPLAPAPEEDTPVPEAGTALDPLAAATDPLSPLTNRGADPGSCAWVHSGATPLAHEPPVPAHPAGQPLPDGGRARGNSDAGARQPPALDGAGRHSTPASAGTGHRGPPAHRQQSQQAGQCCDDWTGLPTRTGSAWLAHVLQRCPLRADGRGWNHAHRSRWRFGRHRAGGTPASRQSARLWHR